MLILSVVSETTKHLVKFQKRELLYVFQQKLQKKNCEF